MSSYGTRSRNGGDLRGTEILHPEDPHIAVPVRLAIGSGGAGVIGAKACSIFHHIATGANVSLISEEQKARYIQFLTEREDDAAESLAIIIGSIKINKNNDIEDGAESFQKPRKTLTQMLEEARQRKGKGKRKLI